MKKKIAKLWVKALRSRRYKQGRGQLRDYDDRFCCLGVLCNLHAQAHPKLAAEELNPRAYLGEISVLPERVVEWAGMQTLSGCYARNGNGASLASDNDEGATFATIANLIEAHVADL